MIVRVRFGRRERLNEYRVKIYSVGRYVPTPLDLTCVPSVLCKDEGFFCAAQDVAFLKRNGGSFSGLQDRRLSLVTKHTNVLRGLSL